MQQRPDCVASHTDSLLPWSLSFSTLSSTTPNHIYPFFLRSFIILLLIINLSNFLFPLSLSLSPEAFYFNFFFYLLTHLLWTRFFNPRISLLLRFCPSEPRSSVDPMMMSHQPRRMLPPGNSRKRKHAEADKRDTSKAEEPTPSSNRLLAGYLAHEFLTKGTLLGQKFEPDSMAGSAEPNRTLSNSKAEASASEPTRLPSVGKEHESYGEVASIMKTDGTHIMGIVNPTQLSRWIHHHMWGCASGDDVDRGVFSFVPASAWIVLWGVAQVSLSFEVGRLRWVVSLLAKHECLYLKWNQCNVLCRSSITTYDFSDSSIYLIMWCWLWKLYNLFLIWTEII